MIERAELARHHRRVRERALGARDALRAFLGERWSLAGDAAELRYLLRVIADARLLDPFGDPWAPLAHALRLLAPLWPPDAEWDAIPLEPLCAAVEAGELEEAIRVLHRGSEHARQPPHRVAARALYRARAAYSMHDCLRPTVHDVARVLGATPDARAAVYREVLRSIADVVTRPVGPADPSADAERLLLWLVDELELVALRADAERAALVERLVTVIEAPLHERSKVLGRLLLTDEAVEDFYADDADLARAMLAWG